MLGITNAGHFKPLHIAIFLFASKYRFAKITNRKQKRHLTVDFTAKVKLTTKCLAII
jgi:hypothetical protein